MIFHTISEVDNFIHSLIYLGQGSQGVCYKDRESKVVYKFYHSYFDRDFEGVWRKEEILQFRNISSSTFVFPKAVIMLNNQVIGDVTPYKKAKNLCQFNPLNINLDRFIKLIRLAIKDIESLSNGGVQVYDVMYNILMGYRMYIIDTLEYSMSDKGYEELLRSNLYGFNLEIMYFLVDGLFLDVISSHSKLKDMYQSKGKDGSIIDFIIEFRSYLEKLLGKDIVYLRDAKMLRDTIVDEDKLKYERDVMVLERVIDLKK